MNKKGFTLVELLAVIAILAILVIIALPNVLKMYNNAKKNIFLTEAKIVYKEASKKYISEFMKGKRVTKINSSSNKLELSGNDLKYNIRLDTDGKIKFFYASDGTYCISGKYKDVNELIIENVKDKDCENENYQPPVIKCTFDGEMTQGAEFVKGLYTYRYKQEGDWGDWSESSITLNWDNIDDDGWGVQLTDKKSTNPVSGEICTYINDKPVVSTALMFEMSEATTLDLSEFNTSTVKYMWGMFKSTQTASIDVSSFDTSNVIDMQDMFFRSSAKTLDLSNFNTSNVTDMSGMFANSDVTSIDVSSFNTSKVILMPCMFAYSKIKKLDLTSFDTSNVTDMHRMFMLETLTELKGLENFDTSNVTNMNGMFWDVNLKSLNVSNFDTSKVTDMSLMFATGPNLLEIKGLEKINTANVVTMGAMFSRSAVTTLDLSNFDTSKVEDMRSMFYNCPNLKTIYVSSKFNTSKVTDSRTMFENVSNLIGGAGTVFDSNKIDKTYARIDGGTSNPGYFTLKN